VAGYSGYRIFEETIRIDSSAHFLGLRLNFFIALVMTVVGLSWFVFSQRRRKPPEPAEEAVSGPSGTTEAGDATEPGSITEASSATELGSASEPGNVTEASSVAEPSAAES
jgi:hypothetical protein